MKRNKLYRYKLIYLIIKAFLPALFILFFACNRTSENKAFASEIVNEAIDAPVKIISEEPALDSLKLDINFKPKGNYTSIINTIKSDKAYFEKLYQVNSTKALDSASRYVYTKLINTIVPHWYGTEWDFNGYTNTPGEGEIACGYFVSTTLKHLGFNLNRYRMAQEGGLNEAQLLQPRSELKIYRNLSFEALQENVNSVYADGVYFVGLDNHVGYMLVKDKELYFLHSSYYDDKVMIELAEISPCFTSDVYVFAEITTNENLIKSWILNQRLSVPN